MAYIAFALCVISFGIVASLVDVDTCTSHMDSPDYHYVPYAGDAFGA